MKKFYTEEQKYTILQGYWSGESVASISADTRVAKSPVYKWIKSIAKKPKAVNMTDFRILKQRCETLEKMVDYRNNYRSEREFRECVGAYMEFYNSKRPHQINRYLTPDAMEESYYKRHTGSGEEN